MKFLILLAILLFSISAPATAKTSASTSLGSFGYWRAYMLTENNQNVCYMTLTARFLKSKKFRRGDALLTITHRPAESSKDVISYTAGYNYKPMSDAELHIGKQTFNLFTTQDSAWSRDAATDHKIAAAIRTSPSLSITGNPTTKGVASFTDKFALKGANEAYRAIGKACGVEVAESNTTKARAKPTFKAIKPHTALTKRKL